jgi:hypothetical protein
MHSLIQIQLARTEQRERRQRTPIGGRHSGGRRRGRRALRGLRLSRPISEYSRP